MRNSALAALHPARDERHGRRNLQHQCESTRETLALPAADPVHGGRFERPPARRPARIRGERNRDRGEDDGQRKERPCEQRPSRLRAAPQRRRERAVEPRHGHGTPRGAVTRVLHQRRLQREPEQRHAEHQQAVDGRLVLQRAARGVQHGDRHVEQEEQDEERLDRREVLRPVEPAAPEQSEREREHEAQHVECAPRAHPRQREDRAVEDREVTEEPRGRGLRAWRRETAPGIRQRLRGRRAAASRRARRAIRSAPRHRPAARMRGQADSTSYWRNAAKIVR